MTFSQQDWGRSCHSHHLVVHLCLLLPLVLASKELFILSDLRKKKRAGTRIREQLEGQENAQKDHKEGDNGNNLGQRSKGMRATQSHYAFNKQAIPPVSGPNLANHLAIAICTISCLIANHLSLILALTCCFMYVNLRNGRWGKGVGWRLGWGGGQMSVVEDKWVLWRTNECCGGEKKRGECWRLLVSPGSSFSWIRNGETLSYFNFKSLMSWTLWKEYDDKSWSK